MLMAKEYDEQRQIDRACSAQSPDLLPVLEHSVDKINKVKERVEKQKAKYTRPPRF